MAVSSSSATVAVEKATSDLLMGPDWTMNIEICDSINSNHWQPKDVVKAVKKRLQHKSSKVQLLALTLLETMVKNCGDYVHFQIADRSILEEMIKIVRKKSDMQVRQKILVLLDSWQEAFGGPNGKYPQYYWAYDELKRSGVVFPKRSLDAAPIFTPPPIHSASRSLHPGYGMSSSSSKTLDETMATEIESLSLSSLDSMRHVMDLLSDMLQAVNPSDRAAVKDEVIVDLVDRCRTNQKKLMQMLTTTGDEELLGRGLELNDRIQSLLARHDAIASGTPLPIQGASSSTRSPEVYTEDHSNVNETDVKSSSPVESDATPKASPSTVVYSETRGLSDEEEEDEFAQLARRHSRAQSVTSKDATAVSGEDSVPLNTSSPISHVPDPETTIPSNALALPNPPAPVSTAKDQDIIDLLSITLSLAPSSPPSTYPQSGSSQGMHQMPAPSRTEGYSYAPQTYPGNSQYNSYVVPWAHPKSQSQSQPQTQQQQMYHQPQSQQQTYQPQSQQHMYQPQSRSQSQQHMYQPQPQSQSQQQMYQQQSQSRSQPATPPSPQQLNAHYGFEQSLHHQQSQQFQAQPQEEQQLQSQPQPQSSDVLQHLPQSPMQTQHPQYSPQQLQHHETQQFEYQPQPQQHLQPQHQPQQNLQAQPQLHSQLQSRPQQQPQQQAQPQQQLQQSQPQPPHVQQPQQQPRFQNQHPQYPARYPPPPWAATPGYPNYQNQISATNVFSTLQTNTTGTYTAQGPYAARGFSGPTTGGDPRANPGPRNPTSSTGQKTFVPSYRLFEDLNVFGNTDGRVKMTNSGSSSSLSGTMGPGMVGGRK